MAVRRGISSAFGAASSSIGDIIKRMLDEESDARKAKYITDRQKELEGMQHSNQLLRLAATNPDITERPGFGLDPRQYGRTSQQRMRPITEQINQGTNSTNMLGDEALKAYAYAEGLGPDQFPDEVGKLMAQRQEREDQIKAAMQREVDLKPRLGEGNRSGFVDPTTQAFMPTERSGGEQGGFDLAKALSGELSPEMTEAKMTQGNELEAGLRGEKVRTAYGTANATAGAGMDARFARKDKLVDLEGALAQARNVSGGDKLPSPALRIVAQEMISLSELLNTAGDTGPGATFQSGMQTFNKYARLDPSGAIARKLDNAVEGFAPMIARLIGHSGVLTQQDVDSVKNVMPGRGLSRTESKDRNAMFMKFMDALDSRLHQGQASGRPMQPGEVANLVQEIMSGIQAVSGVSFGPDGSMTIN